MTKPSKTILAFIISSCCLFSTTVLSLDEVTRLKEYNSRNYTWPMEYYNPPTDGWKALYDRRLAQVADIEADDARYEGFMQSITSAVVAPNFTEYGWALTRAPQALVDDLRIAVHQGMPYAKPERNVDVIEGETPLFISKPGLMNRVLRELRPMHEEWARIELKPSNAYGFRVYKNGSSLNMHVDKPDTHIISSILHIDHSEDSKPWPIVIEDFDGNTNEVVLESGDMLFYESSKCFHGRPRPFEGSWYTSVFTHYRPASPDWKMNERDLEGNYAIPPSWKDHNPSYLDDYESKYGKKVGSPLLMVGTSLKEPDCDHGWCALEKSVKYSGPAVYGEVLSAGGLSKIIAGSYIEGKDEF